MHAILGIDFSGFFLKSWEKIGAVWSTNHPVWLVKKSEPSHLGPKNHPFWGSSGWYLSELTHTQITIRTG
jgi:hypothetical protein